MNCEGESEDEKPTVGKGSVSFLMRKRKNERVKERFEKLLINEISFVKSALKLAYPDRVLNNAPLEARRSYFQCNTGANNKRSKFTRIVVVRYIYSYA